LPDDWQSAGFGVYVHWPFCQSKCPYCDFNSHVSDKIDHNQWLKAYLAEIEFAARRVPERTVSSVFFGGGTPSLMEPETVKAILDAISTHWNVGNDLEVTLEANPTSVEAGKFKAFHQAGVNRISMGIQSLNDDHLRALGRRHSVSEARAAFEIARAEFDRVNFDLIYARQDQELLAWKAELNQALAMAIDHLSLYQLTVEVGTAFGDRFARGLLRGLPSEDLSADMYFATQELCEAAGMPAYEVSNHARAGSECRHNLIYWRYGDYLGVGPGAHGRLTLGGEKLATVCHRAPGAWLDAVKKRGHGEAEVETLTAADCTNEYVLMSMRLSEGMDLGRYAKINGAPVSDSKISHLVDIGMVAVQNGRLIATAAGRPVLNAIIVELLA
jgi:putative oxygen-independent coproporphyrinogen III oxidase